VERNLLVLDTEALRRRLPHALVTDAHRSDRLPRLLG
jgi:hypothetical protein